MLRKELAETRMERDIVKKAAAYFAQESLPSGPLRMQPELAAQGFVAGRDRIARLRRGHSLRCRQKRKFEATTNSNHDLPVAETTRAA